MKPTALRLSLVLVLLVAQLFTALFVFFNMQRETANQITSNAEGTLHQLGRDVADQTGRFLEPAEIAIRLGQQLIADGALDATSDSELEDFFTAQLSINSQLNGLYLGRADGSFIFVNRLQSGLRTKSITVQGENRAVSFVHRNEFQQMIEKYTDPTDQYDPTQRPWYLKARKDNALVWTDAYSFFTTKMPGITAAIPILDDKGADAGVLGVDIDINELSAFISTIPNSQSGSAVIIDENQNAIAYSDSSLVTNVGQASEVPQLEQMTSSSLQVLFEKISETDDPFESDQEGFSRIEADGRQQLAMARPLSLSGGRINWLLMVIAPAEDFSGPLQQLFKEKMWMLAGIILIPGMLAVFAIVHFTKPVYQYHREATTDPLTGALTRAEFRRQLQSRLTSRTPADEPAFWALVALDLDDFRQTNEFRGHAAGDVILSEFSNRLQNRLRRYELVGRMGGDDFLIAIQLKSPDEARQAVVNIHKDIVSSPIMLPSGQSIITVTAGVAVYEQGMTIDALIRRADQALICGKTHARNQCYVYGADNLLTAIAKESETLSALQAANDTSREG